MLLFCVFFNFYVHFSQDILYCIRFQSIMCSVSHLTIYHFTLNKLLTLDFTGVQLRTSHGNISSVELNDGDYSKARIGRETCEAEHPSTLKHHSSGDSKRFVQQPITSLSWQQAVAPLDESLTCINWLRRCRAPKLPLALAGGNGETTNDSGSTKAPDYGHFSGTCATVRPEDQKSCDLDCKRPPYSYAQLISMALRSCSSHRLTIPEIYLWIQKKFPYFRSNANPLWRNSVRHTLSLLPMFTKERVPGEKLSFWSVRDAPAETQARLSAPATARVFNPSKQDNSMHTVNAIGSPSHILVPLLAPIIVSSPSPAVTKTAPTRPRLLAPKVALHYLFASRTPLLKTLFDDQDNQNSN
uniref:Fork-head domain-containing protein n=1 Tax=Eptatretus burgeri TaxID=7764 RepID=A0A8C4PVW1_EPTBU